VYERPSRPRGRHHDAPDDDVAELRAALVAAIDEDPEVRAAILRLFAANRKPRTTTAAAVRRGGRR
jgi:hypothetical protein